MAELGLNAGGARHTHGTVAIKNHPISPTTHNRSAPRKRLSALLIRVVERCLWLVSD